MADDGRWLTITEWDEVSRMLRAYADLLVAAEELVAALESIAHNTKGTDAFPAFTARNALARWRGEPT